MKKNLDLFIATVDEGGFGDLVFCIKVAQKLKEYNPLISNGHVNRAAGAQTDIEKIKGVISEYGTLVPYFNNSHKKHDFAVGFSYLHSDSLEKFLKETYDDRYILITTEDFGYPAKDILRDKNQIGLHMSLRPKGQQRGRVFGVGPFFDDTIPEHVKKSDAVKILRAHVKENLDSSVKIPSKVWKDIESRYWISAYSSTVGVSLFVPFLEYINSSEGRKERKKKVLLLLSLPLNKDTWSNYKLAFNKELDSKENTQIAAVFASDTRPHIYPHSDSVLENAEVLVFIVPPFEHGQLQKVSASSDFLINSGANTLLESLQLKIPFGNYVYGDPRFFAEAFRETLTGFWSLSQAKREEMVRFLVQFGSIKSKDIVPPLLEKFLWEDAARADFLSCMQEMLEQTPESIRDGREFVRKIVEISNDVLSDSSELNPADEIYTRVHTQYPLKQK